MSELKSSHDWLKMIEFRNYIVVEFDGWDRENLDVSMNEQIHKDEFKKRLWMSTTIVDNKSKIIID